MRITFRLFVAAVVAAGALVSDSSRIIEARPQYRTGYLQVYPEDSRGGQLKCTLCHVPKAHETPDTKRRNSYGRKFAKALGEKNVKDMDRIRAALREIGPFPGKDDEDD